MVMKRKKKKKVVEEEYEDPEDEEDEEEENGIEEPDEKDLPPLPKKALEKPSRQEVEDMIEGHLLRAGDLLRLLRSTP